MKEKAKACLEIIDLSSYPPGIYFVKVQGPGISGTEKIILR